MWQLPPTAMQPVLLGQHGSEGMPVALRRGDIDPAPETHRP
jgi:hypothetical protein